MLKSFLSKPLVKVVLVVIAFALPQILPLLPEGSKGQIILGALYSILVGLGIVTPSPRSVNPGTTILKD